MRFFKFKNLIIICVLCLSFETAKALTVFDPSNYLQNTLTALRSLEQIRNQIQQITNQAQMLLRMDQNLAGIDQSIAGELQKSVEQIERLMNEAHSISLNVKEIQRQHQELFPKDYQYALDNNKLFAQTERRLEAELSAFERASKIQGQIAENLKADKEELNRLLQQSFGAVGIKQAQQTGNEIFALGVKQQMQILMLLASQKFAENLKYSSEATQEKEAREQWKSYTTPSSDR